jgi:hypothetical protein
LFVFLGAFLSAFLDALTVTAVLISVAVGFYGVYHKIHSSSADYDEDGQEDKNKEDEGKENCFELVYPLSVTMPDGSVLSGDKENLWSTVKAWYEVNPDSKDKPNLNYPIDVIWKDDVQKTINNELEMEVAKKYCDTEKKDCFGLVYPVSWTLSDGSTADMNDKNDWDAVKAWYEANPTLEEKPTLNYPVDIIFEDGTTQAVADDLEMEDAKKDCE